MQKSHLIIPYDDDDDDDDDDDYSRSPRAAPRCMLTAPRREARSELKWKLNMELSQVSLICSRAEIKE